MRFTAGQVEDAIASNLWIRDDARSQLHARFKKFQAFGIGKGKAVGAMETGKAVGAGRRANLTLEHALQLRLAFELTRLGMTPDRVRGFMLSNWSQVACAMVNIFDRQRETVKEPVYLVAEPSALRDLQDMMADLSELVAACVPGKRLAKRIAESDHPAAPPTLGVINLSSVFRTTVEKLGVAPTDLAAEIGKHWRHLPLPHYWGDDK